MMHLSDFKEKIEKRLENQKAKNKSVEKLEKDMKKQGIFWSIVYFLFLFTSFVSVVIASALSTYLAYPVMAFFMGIMLITLTVFYMYEKNYILLRKALYMNEKEEFERYKQNESDE